MEVSGKLFQENKFCAWCHCPIPIDSETEFCKNCEASMQFREIREYVREHDVNEFQLAETFGIPLRQVKQWIREGRLEYKEIMNTDTDYYTGSNFVNKRAIKSQKVACLGKENSILVDIAPFSGMIFMLKGK